MSKKEEFKLFVKQHPELIRFIKKGEMTWQKFFEIYSLYGNNDEVWKKYFGKEEETKEEVSQESNFSLNELVQMAKKIDLDAVQKNITSINKGLALIESLITKDSSKVTEEYTPRPLYKKFED